MDADAFAAWVSLQAKLDPVETRDAPQLLLRVHVTDVSDGVPCRIKVDGPVGTLETRIPPGKTRPRRAFTWSVPGDSPRKQRRTDVGLVWDVQYVLIEPPVSDATKLEAKPRKPATTPDRAIGAYLRRRADSLRPMRGNDRSSEALEEAAGAIERGEWR